jgi:hypothetical protein
MMSTIVRLLLVLMFALSVNPGRICATTGLRVQPAPPSVIGSWRGDSTCVGDHPACKNEDVVYRFEAVAAEPGSVMLFADKIIAGKREAMGMLKFQFDEAKGTLSGEFTRRQTHGLWEFKIDGDVIEGTLVLLPDKTVARRVKVRRVSEDKLPPAPPREDYG